MTAPAFGFPRQSPASPTIAGAGRVVDLYYPEGDDYFGAPVSKLTGWQSNRANGPYAWTFIQDAGSGDGFASYNQTGVLDMVSGNVGGSINGIILYNTNRLALTSVLQSGHGIPDSLNDYAVCRYAMVTAFVDIPTIDSDFGIELVFPANDTVAGVIRDALPGFGWMLRPSGIPNFMVRGPGGLLFFPLAIPGFDITKFHLYEFRVVGASFAREARLAVYVDLAPVFSFSWGVGTILPSYNAAYGQANFGLCAVAGGSKRFHMQQFRYMASQTELGLLL